MHMFPQQSLLAGSSLIVSLHESFHHSVMRCSLPQCVAVVCQPRIDSSLKQRQIHVVRNACLWCRAGESGTRFCTGPRLIVSGDRCRPCGTVGRSPCEGVHHPPQPPLTYISTYVQLMVAKCLTGCKDTVPGCCISNSDAIAIAPRNGTRRLPSDIVDGVATAQRACMWSGSRADIYVETYVEGGPSGCC